MKPSGLPSLTSRDDLPPGPYTIGMTWGPRDLPEEPYTVVCATGQAVTGHCASRAIAEKIAQALTLACLTHVDGFPPLP